MIVKRQRKTLPKAPKLIVRRKPVVIGAKRGTIVRRGRGVTPPRGGGRGSLISWRPSRGFLVV